MLKEKITVGESINLINESILDFEDGLSSEAIEKISYAVNGEIQVRDYLLGMPTVYPLTTCLDFLNYISQSVNESERCPFQSVLSAYFYELGEPEISVALIDSTLSINPTYSLGLLLQRVYKAGWSANSFVSMRNDLHGQVVEMLEEMQDTYI